MRLIINHRVLSDMEKENKEIPFGAKDSELYKFEYTIPEGYEARIEDGKVIVKKKESEDERIRKALVKTFEKKLEIGFEWTEFGIPNRSVLDWLEKQKEPQNNSDAPNESSWEGTTSSSDNGRNLDELAREYIDGVKQYHPTPTWDLMQTAVCYGYHLGEEVGSEGVESVKPIEWSEEDENTLECSNSFKRFVDMVHSVDKGEFTEFEYSIINFVLACCDKNIAMTPKGIHCYAKTILNIVKKEFTPKNCGWTDEEETVLHNACEFIRHRLNDSVCRNGNIGGMDYNILYEKLKSLRPQPHWKPSEYTLSLVKKVAGGEMLTGVEQMAMGTLYEQLKKL